MSSRRWDQGQRRVPSTFVCDAMFSEALRERGSWWCVRCRRKFINMKDMIGASHFFNKGRHANLRYDPRNVDPLCHECHTGKDGWEYQKAGAYMTFMIQKLGVDGYEQLRMDALVPVKLDEAKAVFIEKLEGGTLWDSTAALTGSY